MAAIKHNPQTWQTLRDKMQDRPSAMLGPNTVAVWLPDGDIAIMLHDNMILKFGLGIVKLYDGGYRSAVTKARINELTPDYIHMYQDKGHWYIDSHLGTEPFYNGIPFYTG